MKNLAEIKLIQGQGQKISKGIFLKVISSKITENVFLKLIL